MIRSWTLLTLIFLSGSFSVFSQNAQTEQVDSTLNSDKKPKHYLQLEAEYLSFSNALNTGFFNALTGISDLSAPSLVADLSEKENYLMMDNKITLRYFRINSKPKSKFQGIAAGYRQFLSLGFSEDAFSLFFHGNSAFAGDTAFLDGTQFHAQSYYFLNSTFRFAFSINKEKESRLELSLQPSILLGNSCNSLLMNKAGLYTAPYGQYLDLYADYQWQSSSAGHFNGIGAGLNAQLAMVFENGWRVAAAVQNLGLIYYNSNSEIVQLDSSFHYEGMQFPVITELSSFTPDTAFTSDILNDFYNSHKKQGSFISGTAPTVEFSVTKYYKDLRFIATAKTVSYLQDLRMNYTTLNLAFMPANKFSLILTPGIASFSKVFLSAGVRFSFPSHGSIAINAGDLLGFIKPENSQFQRINCSWIYLF